MGYDMNMAVFKKKTLEEIQGLFPDYTFRDLYSTFLFTRLYPDEYDFPKDEEARDITWANRNVFYDFFEPKIENDEAIIIDKETYEKMMDWLEKKLKSKTLYDMVWENDDGMYEFREMIRIYRQMLDTKIDFETEFIVYQHDW